jgi:hypothetical protein
MIWFILHHKKNLIEITVKDEKLKKSIFKVQDKYNNETSKIRLP